MNAVIRLCLLWGVLLGASASASLAQINIESSRLDDQITGLQFQIEGELDLRRGNAKLLELGLKPRMDYRKGNYVSFLLAQVSIEQSDDVDIVNTAMAHARVSYRLRTGLFAETFLQVESNDQQLLKNRFLAGAGIRTRLYRRPDNQVALQIGMTPMLEMERIDVPPTATHPAEVVTGRLSTYLSGRADLTDLATLTHATYYQPRFDAFADLRLLTETQLELKITKAFALTTAFTFRYDTRPPDNVGRGDLRLEQGLKVQF